MKIYYYILISTFLISCRESITPDLLINQVVDIIEQNSIYKDSIDFEKIRQDALKRINDSSIIDDAYPIIQDVLSQLGDNHSHIYKPEQSNNWKSRQNKTDNFNYKTKILNDQIGYIFLPYFVSGNSRINRKYAQRLQDEIKELDQENDIKGWIIDLRMNFGGNCWPMLTGLGPLIGDGIIGYFIDSDKNMQKIKYKDGMSFINEQIQLKVNNPIFLQKRNTTIAILISEKTSSSGELIAILFKGKSQSIFFGNKTQGLTTGNDSFNLIDGSILFLTTSYFVDRNKNIYLNGINPDKEYYYFNSNFKNPEDDMLIRNAIQYIEE